MVTLITSGSNVAYAIFGSVGVQGSSVFADNFSFTPFVRRVHEPASLALAAVGLAAPVATRRRRR